MFRTLLPRLFCIGSAAIGGAAAAICTDSGAYTGRVTSATGVLDGMKSECARLGLSEWDVGGRAVADRDCGNTTFGAPAPPGPAVVPENNYWIATPRDDGLWTTDANWSLGARPAGGQNVTFNSTHSNLPCLIPAGLNLPALHSVTLGDWIGVLTAKSNLMADTITINPRTGLVNNDLVIGPKATVTATSDLEFLGGAVAGGPTATLRANGTLNVNGASAADKPTLGVMLQVGDGAAPTIMTLMDGSQPLVVKGSARITVNERASLFIRSGESKKAEETVTAVSNGDSGPLTIDLNGGTLKRFADGQVYVGMGVTIENGGKLVAYAGGHSGAGPLHIVWQNANGTGLDVSRGTVEAAGGDLWVDGHAYFYDGTVIVGADATFTVGTNVKSPMSCMYGGTFDLKGTLEAHGGFGLFGGTLGTDGSAKATMRVDDGNRFWLNDGGELDVTKGGNGPNAAAAGGLVISGDFTASRGTIVNNVDSRAHGHAQGNFRVTGNVTLAADTIFSSRDLNPDAGAVGRGWRLFSWEGTRSGACGFNLPPKWATAWTDATPTAAGYLGVAEP